MAFTMTGGKTSISLSKQSDIPKLHQESEPRSAVVHRRVESQRVASGAKLPSRSGRHTTKEAFADVHPGGRMPDGWIINGSGSYEYV